MRALILLTLLSLCACAPLAPSEPKNADHSCDGPTSKFDSVTLNSDSTYDVQTKMGSAATSEAVDENNQPVWTYDLCKDFVFTFDLSGHVTSKSIK